MLRVRLYKATRTHDGFVIETTLLDTPLDPKRWTKREQAEFARLERLVEPK